MLPRLIASVEINRGDQRENKPYFSTATESATATACVWHSLLSHRPF